MSKATEGKPAKFCGIIETGDGFDPIAFA